MNYNKILVNLRYEKNIKQKDIAKKMGISSGLYNMYETEYKIIPSKHLNSLCEAFNISVDYLFSLTKTQKYKNSKKTIDLDLLNKRLKEFRKENDLTQKDLAEKLNVSQSVISDFEKQGKIIPTFYLYLICKIYNISADYLLGKTNNKNIE